MWNRLCCSLVGAAWHWNNSQFNENMHVARRWLSRLVRFENEPRGGGWAVLCCQEVPPPLTRWT